MKILILFPVVVYYATFLGFARAKGIRLHGEICKEVEHEVKKPLPDEMTCDEERGLTCVKRNCVCSSTMHYGPMEWVPEEQKCLGSTGFICNFDELIPFNSSRDDQKCASGYCDKITSKTEVCNPVLCVEKTIHQCGPSEYKYKPISISFTLEDLKELCVYGIVYLIFILVGIAALHLRATTILR